MKPPPEPCARPAEQIELVIAFRERVSFARVDDELVLDPEPAERTVEVDRLADRHVGVVLAVRDQHRPMNWRCG